MGDLSPEVLQLIITKMIVLILSIAVHEFGHAFVADRLGDSLPRQQGRVTLNPLAHADPIGSVALPAFSLLFSNGLSTGFGWGRPVQVRPVSFDRRFHMRTGHMFVAAAGPAMNVVFGIVISLVLFILMKTNVLVADSDAHARLIWAMQYAVRLNIVLAFFNMIPAPPLDGGTVIQAFLPSRALAWYGEYIAPYGLFILMAFIMIGTLAQGFLWPAMKLYMLWMHSVLGIA